MRRVRLVLEYDGTEFCGFQRQRQAPSVQGRLEEALSRVCGHPVETTGAGRTDAGVHALGQVVHFDTTGGIPGERVPRAVNSLVGPELVVRHAEETGDTFHARFSAVRRTYHYYVCRSLPPPYLARYVLHDRRLGADAAERMGTALRALEGTHDFAAFGAPSPEVKTPVRTVAHTAVREEGRLLRIEIAADAFLRSMVRIVTGLALEIGAGNTEPEAMAQALAAGERPRWTALPHGLFLAKVDYADGFGGLLDPGPFLFSWFGD